MTNIKIPRALGCAILFVFAGMMHFVTPETYMKIMPPLLPYPLFLIYLTGVWEIVGGIGLLFSRFKKIAAISLIILLVAVFPANIYMAMNPDIFPSVPIWARWLRLPLQFLLIAWVWRYRR